VPKARKAKAPARPSTGAPRPAGGGITQLDIRDGRLFLAGDFHGLNFEIEGFLYAGGDFTKVSDCEGSGDGVEFKKIANFDDGDGVCGHGNL
jgi:hypothetical protein